MTQLLKQSTAATIKIGPFVDSTDGVTAETGLTISQADIRLSKNGGAFAQTNNATGATHDENGYYGVPLDTTDTNTLGRLRVAVNESGSLPVWQDFMVVNANVYDSLIGGSDNLQVDTVQIEGSDATDQINAAADTALTDYDPPTKAELDSGLAALNDLSAAQVNAEVDTALADIHLDHLLAADYDPASKPGTATALLNELIENDGGVSRFTANALEQAPTGGSAPTAADIADAVWDEAKAGHVAAGSFGEEVQAHALSSEISALNDLSAAQVNAEVDTALVDYDAPTKAELDSGLAALNDLDAAGIRAAVGMASANLDTQLGALPTAAENRAEMDSNSTQLAAIVADTNELQTDDIPGLIAALNNISAADVNAQVDAAFTTQMADSVATDGSIATREQALYMILQFLTEFAISGTTLTVKKVDGSTTLMSFTLDDATNPTSLTRS